MERATHDRYARNSFGRTLGGELMYRLENNVEWTEELKNAFKHNVTRAKIIYNDSNETIIINENTGIKEISLEDNKYVPQTGFIGQATSRKVTLTLLDNQQTTNLENKEFTLYIGADYNNTTYYINYGNFIVNEPPENDSTNGTIKIVAYDYMIKFNKIYENTITFPCTLKNYLINICNQADVQLGSQGFTNDDFIVVNNQFEGKTLREVLQHIGKTAFSWVRIGQDNKLYLDFKANDINATIETITTDDYKQDAYKKANEYYGPINKVTYGDSDIQGQEESVEDSISIAQNGVNELIINDNYFAYTTSKRHELIQEGTVLFGLSYMPISQLELIGLVYLDCNDYIQVEDTEGNSITSRVFSHTIKYNGAVSDSIENEGTSDTQETYKNTNTTAANNSRTEIVVDRANKKIQSIVEDVTQQNNKISVLTQTVDELSSKISDVADVTVHGESDYAVVSLEDINESEPIMVKVHAIGENISYTYPSDILYPSDTTYLKNRILRFTNTNTQTFVDYELPDNLLYYNSEIYDEFYLDYESHTCEVTKRCGYNADGTVYALAEEVVTSYTYPTIELQEGNYTIRLLGYETAYLFVRLMASNIYTTQFATKVEVNSAITQTTQNINLSVNQKLTNYSTTNEMNTAINLAKDSITSTVSQTYITKTDSANNINTAKNDAINSANNSTDNKLTNYYTKVQTNSQINQKANEITSSVSETYSTKTETTNAKNAAINSANSSTDTKLQNYYTKAQTESKITQKANEINASVSATYATQSSVTASLSLKVNTADLISEINASADKITLTGNRISITSNRFKLTEDGEISVVEGSFKIVSTNNNKMVDFSRSGLRFYNYAGNEIGALATTYLDENGNMFLTLTKGDSLNISKTSSDGKYFTQYMVFDDLNSTPYIRNTANGTLFQSAGGGIQVENGLIKSWNMNYSNFELNNVTITGIKVTDGLIESVTYYSN